MNNLQSARKSWRDKDIDTMMSMKRDGFTDADIGEILGRSAKAVSVRHSKVMRRYELCLLYTSPSPRDH